MKVFATAAFALATVLATGPVQASDFVTVTLSKDLDVSAEAAWKKIGGFCQIDKWMEATCSYKSGTGNFGSVRTVALKATGQGGEELMVSQTPLSYTYTMTGPFLPFYHGSMAVEATGKGKSKVVYTILWDQEPLPADQKQKTKDMMTQNFTGALENMKKVAEAK